MKRSKKAQLWRKARGFSVKQLSELTGYSIESVYIFERGANPDGSDISDFVWQRYKTCCAGIDAQIRSGIVFQWEV